MRNQDHIQWQEQDSRCQIKDWDIQAKKETHSRLHDRVWSIGHEGWYRPFAYHLLIKEECVNKHYYDNIRIPTNGSIQNIKRIESGDHINQTRIWVHRRTTRL